MTHPLSVNPYTRGMHALEAYLALIETPSRSSSLSDFARALRQKCVGRRRVLVSLRILPWFKLSGVSRLAQEAAQQAVSMKDLEAIYHLCGLFAVCWPRSLATYRFCAEYFTLARDWHMAEQATEEYRVRKQESGKRAQRPIPAWLGNFAPRLGAMPSSRTGADVQASRDLALSISSMTVRDFRNRISGKRVCLVLADDGLSRSGIGREIDRYDVVIRFGDYRRGKPADLGCKVDVHVMVPTDPEVAWAWKVPVRIILSDDVDEWREAVKSCLQPWAQTFVGTEEFNSSSPSDDVMDGALCGPSTVDLRAGMHMLSLLLDLAVNPSVELFGFNRWLTPNASGISSLGQKDWIKRMRVVNNFLISVQPG